MNCREIKRPESRNASLPAGHANRASHAESEQASSVPAGFWPSCSLSLVRIGERSGSVHVKPLNGYEKLVSDDVNRDFEVLMGCIEVTFVKMQGRFLMLLPRLQKPIFPVLQAG